ncbi:MAG: efflux RND transporter periplasmic adaptor subunit [Mariprofundaceae bacterium]
MNKWGRILLPVAILLAGLSAGMALIATGPKAERHPQSAVEPVVEAISVMPEDFPVLIRSQGVVSPRTQSTLIPEVAGRVVWIAPGFRNGGFFEAGERLLAIDPANYENAATVARAELVRARLALAEEEAQAGQARRDWDKLGLAGEPGDLVLRLPQLGTAKADVAAAEAKLKQAEIDLARTHILAPYAGRVLEKRVDVGQYVSPGAVLADVYAVDYVEVRLPINDEQLAFIDLPEHYRGDGPTATLQRLPVVLRSRLGREVFSWQGAIVRSEGAIDSASRQLFVVAQVDDPYARHGDTPPLKVGQFVEAEITGRVLRDVFVLPRQVLENGERALVINAERRIERRSVDVVWRDGDRVVVAAGLSTGERVSLTPLPFAANGAAVRIYGEDVKPKGQKR